MIRIVGGLYRGRKINVPSGKNVKATSDKLREAIFNILSSVLNWKELTAIDLYSGSGSLGLEALSRGAKKAIFVEISKKNIRTIKKNIELISPEQDRVEMIQNRALQWIPHFLDSEFKCVTFLDPPFSSNEYDPILEKISILSVVKKGSFIVVQSPKCRKINIPKNLEIIKHRRYGSVMLHILQKY